MVYTNETRPRFHPVRLKFSMLLYYILIRHKWDLHHFTSQMGGRLQMLMVVGFRIHHLRRDCRQSACVIIPGMLLLDPSHSLYPVLAPLTNVELYKNRLSIFNYEDAISELATYAKTGDL